MKRLVRKRGRESNKEVDCDSFCISTTYGTTQCFENLHNVSGMMHTSKPYKITRHCAC